ncbi:MAG TPA: hypothetical protein PKJ08_08430, partial [Candidatus Cloacimonadota bacterium]|nr:hypothetical protein [Candidatus Cloacimonadota bacterium]
DFETLRVRLVNLYQDAEKAGQVFEQFKVIAATTPFELRNVVEAGASLKAFGLNAEDTLKSVADLAAFMGVDIVEASQAVGRAFAGGAGAADILRERGVLQLISSFKGIDDLTKISLPEFRQAMLETFSDPASGIAGATDLLAQTYTGAVSNMKDAWTNFMSAMGSTVTPVVGAGARAFTAFLESITPVKTEIEKVTDQTISQQAEFSSLVETYKILRFEQKQNVESNSALKGIIDKLNKDYGQYIGNIDLATTSYKNFQKAVEKANDELIKEAQIKLINAEKSDLATKVSKAEFDRRTKISDIQKDISSLDKKRIEAQNNLIKVQQQYETAKAIGTAHLFTASVEQASKVYESYEKQIASKQNKIKSVNNEYNKEISEAKKELEEFSKTWADLIINATEPPEKGGGGGGSDDKKTDSIQKEIESLRRSLLEKEDILKEDYETNRQFILLNIKDKQKQKEMLTALDRKYAEDYDDLNKVRYQSEKQLTDDMDKLYKEDLQNKYETISENYKILQEYHDYQYDITASAEQRRFDVINNFYDQYKSLLISMGLTEEEIEAQRKERLRQASEAYYAFQKAVESVQSAIEGAFGNVLTEVIVEHKSFAKQMTQVWKNLRIAIIQQIEAILVKMLLLKIAGFLTGNPIGWGVALNSAVTGNIPGKADGGYFKGAGGPKEDKNLVLLSNGEYVVNAEKTSYLKPFLDFLNYAPMSAVRNAIGSFGVPSIPVIPQIAYASGGMVTSGVSLNNDDTKLLLEKVVDRLERLEKKDYSINVQTKFKGVEFAREIQKANAEYERRL